METPEEEIGLIEDDKEDAGSQPQSAKLQIARSALTSASRHALSILGGGPHLLVCDSLHVRWPPFNERRDCGVRWLNVRDKRSRNKVFDARVIRLRCSFKEFERSSNGATVPVGMGPQDESREVTEQDFVKHLAVLVDQMFIKYRPKLRHRGHQRQMHSSKTDRIHPPIVPPRGLRS